MAKFTITRLLDVTRISKTDAGKQMPEFFEYLSQFVEQTVRNLRSGLTFGDNFAGETRTIELKHGVPQTIISAKTVVGVVFTRVQSNEWLLARQGWYYDRNNRLTIAVGFAKADGTSATSADSASVDLVLLY